MQQMQNEYLSVFKGLFNVRMDLQMEPHQLSGDTLHTCFHFVTLSILPQTSSL